MNICQDSRSRVDYVDLFQTTQQRVQLFNGALTCNQRDKTSIEWQCEKQREKALQSHISRQYEDAAVET
jgi:hypothetical protein